jgi:hypothetical protein
LSERFSAAGFCPVIEERVIGRFRIGVIVAERGGEAAP